MADNRSERYVMGHKAEELQRLEAQGRFLRPVTRSLFLHAGMCEGQTVLDFGCGAGDVSLLAAEIVGPKGQVIGIDRSAEALAVARYRAEEHGANNIRFLQGDEWLIGTEAVPAESIDAVVGRLVLMYQPDSAPVVRQLVSALRPGGILAFQEFNLASGGASLPYLPLFQRAWDWALRAARRAGLDVEIGLRLPGLCRAAGLTDVEANWMGRLTPGSDPLTFELAAGIIRGLLPVIVGAGIATAEAVGIETLAQRMHDEAIAANATVSYATGVGVRARKPR